MEVDDDDPKEVYEHNGNCSGQEMKKNTYFCGHCRRDISANVRYKFADDGRFICERCYDPFFVYKEHRSYGPILMRYGADRYHPFSW